VTLPRFPTESMWPDDGMDGERAVMDVIAADQPVVRLVVTGPIRAFASSQWSAVHFREEYCAEVVLLGPSGPMDMVGALRPTRSDAIRAAQGLAVAGGLVAQEEDGP
jgi:hypothetical protein